MKHLLLYPEDRIEYLSGGKQTCRVGDAVGGVGTADTLVLLLGCEGSCRIAINGRERDLNAGDFLLLLSASATVCQGELTHYRCRFRLPRGTRHGIATAEPCADGLLLPFDGKAPSPARAAQLFEQLLDVAHRHTACRDTLCGMALMLLLSELTATEEATAHTAATAVGVTDWIRTHIEEIGSAKDVAARLEYNCEYLTTLLRRSTGKTLTELIRHARVEKAKDLLLCTPLSVKEIAHRCGFSDEKYFLKVCRAAVGITPAQYRNAAKEQ